MTHRERIRAQSQRRKMRVDRCSEVCTFTFGSMPSSPLSLAPPVGMLLVSHSAPTSSEPALAGTTSGESSDDTDWSSFVEDYSKGHWKGDQIPEPPAAIRKLTAQSSELHLCTHRTLPWLWPEDLTIYHSMDQILPPPPPPSTLPELEARPLARPRPTCWRSTAPMGTCQDRRGNSKASG